MRIMATSDLHGNLEGLDPKGADVVVFAGDIAPLRGRGPWHINLKIAVEGNDVSACQLKLAG